MTKQQEGVIKFNLAYTPGPPPAARRVRHLNRWRSILYAKRLIGQDPARYGGYGYGNLSRRLPPYEAPPAQRAFVISGTQTGHLAHLTPAHYTTVVACEPATNTVRAVGPVRPSSESLTHAAVYAIDPAIRVVMHAHAPAIWRRAAALSIPVTDPQVPYGSPEMAAEVARLFAASAVAARGIFVMGGHEDGVVAFGHTVAQTGKILLATLAAAQKLAT